MINNFWRFIGTIQNEPKKMKLGENNVCAKFILAVKDNNESDTILPIVAYNKKAQILCAIAHKGSVIHAVGTVLSNTDMTKNGKVLVGIKFKLTDFDVLSKEPVKDNSYIDTLELYDPDTFMKGEDKDVE